MTSNYAISNPITRPEHAAIGLVEAILNFTSPPPHQSKLEVLFRRQSAGVREAIRRHWVVDHLPAYAILAGIGLTEFQRELAERFWDEFERQTPQRYRPKKRQEATA